MNRFSREANQLRKLRTLGVCLAIALATPAIVFAGDDNQRDPNQAENTLAEKVDSGELITTSGNGENAAASGDVGKDTIPDPLMSQDGDAASPETRPDATGEPAVAAEENDDSDADSTMASTTDEPTKDLEDTASIATTGMEDATTRSSDATVASAGTGTSDESITSNVKTGLGTSDVDVHTYNGVVCLSGEVASFDEKMRLARAAAQVEGVTQIDASRLDVSGSTAVAKSEEE